MEVNNGLPNGLVGGDGLCEHCRYRRGQLAARNRLQSIATALVGGLPLCMLGFQVAGMFQLDGFWLTLYIGGVLAFTAVVFRLNPKVFGGYSATPEQSG